MARILPRFTHYCHRHHHHISTVNWASLTRLACSRSFLILQTPLAADKLSGSDTNEHPQALITVSEAKGEAMDSTRERQGKEASDPKLSKRVSDHIMPHILNLYGSCAKPEDFDIYAADASFEDPLMHARGVKQIKSAFYSLPKVFSESRIVDYDLKEDEISPGKQQILIDNKQHYKFMGKSIDVVSLITLHVENGKVVRHEDWWDKKPLKNKDTVSLPLVGRAIEMARRGSMLMTHAMMGFGKDPNQS